jgi:hypothetical protein
LPVIPGYCIAEQPVSRDRHVKATRAISGLVATFRIADCADWRFAGPDPAGHVHLPRPGLDRLEDGEPAGETVTALTILEGAITAGWTQGCS